MFRSFVLAMNKLKIPSCPKSVPELRAACAAQLSEWEGNIPGMPYSLFQDGKTLFQRVRGEKEKWITLEEYCDLLRTSLYGGLEEMKLIIEMYKLQVCVYQADSYQGGEPIPELFLRNQELSEDDKFNAGDDFVFYLLSQSCNSRSLAHSRSNPN
jgi:hypothetical protein